MGKFMKDKQLIKNNFNFINKSGDQQPLRLLRLGGAAERKNGLHRWVFSGAYPLCMSRETIKY
jgi:hypothetical protein